MAGRLVLTVLPAIFAVYMPTCRPPEVRPTMPASEAPIAELWERPDDLAERDLFYGEWGREHVPDPDVPYRFLKRKKAGMNPGMTVVDPRGREWSVKQAPHDEKTPEGPIEVVVSRVLSAVGYHQPPSYFLPSFTLADQFGTRTEPGGRFRLDHPSLKEQDVWSWQENPFVGTRPYQGLLVILLMLNSTDLKNENNSLYKVTSGDRVEQWFVVRDLGLSLGRTGKVSPPRGDPDLFEEEGFITGLEDGFVTFNYQGYHKEIIERRITPEDVRWASDLLGRLSERQWRDAFRAGTYGPETSARFIRRILAKIEEGRKVGMATSTSASR